MSERKEKEKDERERGGRTLGYAKLTTIRQSTMPLISSSLRCELRIINVFCGCISGNGNRKRQKFALGF